MFQFGSNGNGDGQFDCPRGIAVSQSGHIFVVDWNNHRVQLFDSNGKFISKIASKGNGNDQFKCPFGITIDELDERSGYVLIADQFNKRVQIFNYELVKQQTSNELTCNWNWINSIDGMFEKTCGVAINSMNQILVTDSSGRIFVF